MGGKVLNVIGLFLILIGFLCNEWILAVLFSRDGVLHFSSRIIIWGFDILLIGTGVYLVKYRKSVRFTNFVRLHPNMIALLFGIGVCVALLFCAEAICFVLNQMNKEHEFRGGESIQGFLVDDQLLGYKPKANSQVTSILKKNGKLVYDVTYSIDSLNRRKTLANNVKERNQFIIFFGCSFTFGIGLNDNQTLPFFVSEYTNRYIPYNYGCGGYGPQQMLAKLQSDEIKEEIIEPQGMGIYVFIDHHILRAIGSMSVYYGWGRHFPYYLIDKKDELVRKGNFTSGRPILSFIYHLAGKSQIRKYFSINHPFKVNERHIYLTARIINESFLNFKDKFKNSDFYVLFYPGYSEYRNKLKHYLEGSGIKYLDYSDLFNRSDKRFIIVGDGHPSAHANMVLARKLCQDIGIFNK